MCKGKIIFLNGASSAGKTTLSKALQEKLVIPFYWMSEDVFVDMLHKKFVNNDSEANEQACSKAISGLYHTAKLYSDLGMNVIVDTVTDEQEWLDEILDILHDYPVLFVHVTCPLDEIKRREKERGDRIIGLAEEQISLLCPLDNTYDIIVDTHKNTYEECADKIIELLNGSEKYTAFETLWSRREK